MDLSARRTEYEGRGLSRRDLAPDPFAQFETWFGQASEAGVPEPNAMVLATAGKGGWPASRTVLLKFADPRGFVFFTNLGSEKARHLRENPNASAVFPWLGLGRQVIANGAVSPSTVEEAAEYFARRPRESQIGAWASRQSAVIPSRQSLDDRVAEIEGRFGDGEIPLPPFWGGFHLAPRTVEFWQGRRGRLHDRFRYTLRDAPGPGDAGAEGATTGTGFGGRWQIDRLSP